MYEQLTEKDLEQIFIASRYKKSSSARIVAKFFLIFVLVCIIVFIGFNYSAYLQKIKFWYRDEFQTIDKPLSKALLGISDISSADVSAISQIADNSIYIERIDVKAPIIFRVENNESDVSANLKKGVIHIAGTSLPGKDGNVFVTGHSSNFPWVVSNYNAIFALLGEEVVGDLVMIRFNGINYIYQIENKFIVNPSETKVMESYVDYPTLTLMTCSPVGTNINRLIIQAKQILPEPTKGTGNIKSEKSQALPTGIR